MEILSLRINKNDLELIKNYAKVNNKSVSLTIREAILEKIENEIDLELYKKAETILNKKEPTITHDELLKKLGLNEML